MQADILNNARLYNGRRSILRMTSCMNDRGRRGQFGRIEKHTLYLYDGSPLVTGFD